MFSPGSGARGPGSVQLSVLGSFCKQQIGDSSGKYLPTLTAIFFSLRAEEHFPGSSGFLPSANLFEEAAQMPQRALW